MRDGLRAAVVAAAVCAAWIGCGTGAGGTDGESHFVCAIDEDCVVRGHGLVCMEGTCLSAQSDAPPPDGTAPRFDARTPDAIPNHDAADGAVADAALDGTNLHVEAGASLHDAAPAIDAGADAAPPPGGPGVDAADAATDADSGPLRAPLVYSPWWSEAADCWGSCTYPLPSDDFACRATAEPNTLIYRDAGCWDAWHPWGPPSSTFDFTRDMFVVSCSSAPCMTPLAFSGATQTGASIELYYRAGMSCDQVDCDCGAPPVAGTLLPASDLPVTSHFETEPGALLSVDGGLVCDGAQRQCPEPSSPGAPSDCARACTSDADCRLFESRLCDCSSGGLRVAAYRSADADWFDWNAPCDGPDVCADCGSGYGGAVARCVGGSCTAVCEPPDASASLDATGGSP